MLVRTQNLPIVSDAKDEKLCTIFVDGSVAFGKKSQVACITGKILLSSVCWVTKKVAQVTNDVGNLIETNTLNANRSRCEDVFKLVINKYSVLRGRFVPL